MKKKFIYILLATVMLFTFTLSMSGCFGNNDFHNKKTCLVCNDGAASVNPFVKEVIFSMTTTPGTGGAIESDLKRIAYNNLSQLYYAIDRVTPFPDISKWEDEKNFGLKSFYIKFDPAEKIQIGYHVSLQNNNISVSNENINIYIMTALYDWLDPNDPDKKTELQQWVEEEEYEVFVFTEEMNGIEVKYYYRSKFHSGAEAPSQPDFLGIEYIYNGTLYTFDVAPWRYRK